MFSKHWTLGAGDEVGVSPYFRIITKNLYLCCDWCLVILLSAVSGIVPKWHIPGPRSSSDTCQHGPVARSKSESKHQYGGTAIDDSLQDKIILRHKLETWQSDKFLIFQTEGRNLISGIRLMEGFYRGQVTFCSFCPGLDTLNQESEPGAYYWWPGDDHSQGSATRGCWLAHPTLWLVDEMTRVRSQYFTLSRVCRGQVLTYRLTSSHHVQSR